MPPHIEELKTRIVRTLKPHDVARAAIFGSFARGDAEENSDLDLLVEFIGEKSLDLVGLKLELEDSLGRSVDVLTYNALHPPTRPDSERTGDGSMKRPGSVHLPHFREHTPYRTVHRPTPPGRLS